MPGRCDSQTDSGSARAGLGGAEPIDNDSDDNGILASITLPSADGIKCNYHLPLFIYLFIHPSVLGADESPAAEPYRQ